jgi:hypothetical protein
LKHYEVKLPVMPENGRHYLGLNFARVKQFVDQLREEPEVLAAAANEGKRWAELHHSPKAAAERLLRLCGYDARRVGHLPPIAKAVATRI